MPTILDTSLGADPPTVEVPTLLLGGPATPADVRSIPPGAVPISPQLPSEGSSGRPIVALSRRWRPNAGRWPRLSASGISPMTKRGSTRSRQRRMARGCEPSLREDAAAALIRNGVLGSLEPLMSAAEAAGVSAPVTRSVIAVAEAAMGADLSARTLDRIGLGGRDANQVRALVMKDPMSLGQAVRSESR